MKNEKFDLAKAIYDALKTKEPLSRLAILKEVIKQTGISSEEFSEIMITSDGQTVGQVKYRILGLMDKKKINSSHII